MNYKEWSCLVDGIEKRKQQRGCMYSLNYIFWLFAFTAFKGFLYTFGAWVFLKMIGVTL
jgi:fatty acid desaturase